MISRFLCWIGCHHWDYPGGHCMDCGKCDELFERHKHNMCTVSDCGLDKIPKCSLSLTLKSGNNLLLDVLMDGEIRYDVLRPGGIAEPNEEDRLQVERIIGRLDKIQEYYGSNAGGEVEEWMTE